MLLALYCLLLFLLCVWVFINVMTTPTLTLHAFKPVKVSILISLPNEQQQLQDYLAMLQKLTYPNLEIVLYDPHAVLHNIKLDVRFRVMTCGPVPSDWNEQAYIRHHLRQQATGHYLLFINPQLSMKPATIEGLVSHSQQHEAALITGFPQFSYQNGLDSLTAPLIHWFIYLHLPILITNRLFVRPLTVVNSNFMFFEREAYDEVGGYEAVYDQLQADLSLAYEIKTYQYPTCLMNVSSHIQGTTHFSTLFGAIGYIPLFAYVMATIFYTTIYILPAGLAIYALAVQQPIFAFPYALVVLQRMISDVSTRTPLSYATLMPASIAVMLILCWYKKYKIIKEDA